MDGFDTSPRPREDLLIGKTIAGRYVVDRLLGKGGMGAVYAARQLPLGRAVALKTIEGGAGEGSEERRRFEQEARAIASLSHPNAVKLIDFGTLDDGDQYLVMELLAGAELRQVIESEAPMPEERVLHIVEQVLEVLVEAHALGIIHRDLKPSNIFLAAIPGKLDYVKVLDFGVAKVDSAAAAAITQTGKPLGTPKYMSPEQCRATSITAATDLYSLGVIAYEMLVGAAPFECASPSAYYIAHAIEPPRPLAVDGAPLSGPLADFVRLCLEKDPAARPASAQAALDLLRGPAAKHRATRDGAPVRRADEMSPNTAAPVVPTMRVDHDAIPAGFVTGPGPGIARSPSRRSRAWVPFALVGALAAASVAVVLLAGRDAEGEAREASGERTAATSEPPSVALTRPTVVSITTEDATSHAEGSAVTNAATTRAGAVADAGPEVAATRSAEVNAPVVAVVADIVEAPDTALALRTDAATQPRTLRVVLEARPSAARFKVNGEVGAAGRVEVSWREGEAPPEVVAQLAGHRSTKLVLAPGDDGTTKRVTLAPIPKAEPAGTTPAEPLLLDDADSGIERL